MKRFKVRDLVSAQLTLTLERLQIKDLVINYLNCILGCICFFVGTHFLSSQIEKNRVDALHERIGKMGSVSWVYGAPYQAYLHKQETW